MQSNPVRFAPLLSSALRCYAKSAASHANDSIGKRRNANARNDGGRDHILMVETPFKLSPKSTTRRPKEKAV